MQEDVTWRQDIDAIGEEDRVAAAAYNAVASGEFRLHAELGPMPHFGAIARAPIVLLIAHPIFDAGSTLHDHGFRRPGWPLAALHPDAPSGARRWWHERLAQLIVAFGAQHVANAIAAIPLTPWASVRFDRDLRLPSRQRMLASAAAAARRGALIITTREAALWTESPEIAELPPWQNIPARSWRSTHVDPINLGHSGWSLLYRRIDTFLHESPDNPR